jgi:hypothetical protein
VEGDAAKVQESKRRMDQEVRPLAEEVARALEAKRTGSTSSITSNTSAPTSTSSSTSIGDGLGKLRNELFGGGSARNAAATAAANETRVAEISASSGYRAPTLDNTDLEQGGVDVGTDHASSASSSRAAAADTATDQAILESERLLLESQALCADSEQVGASTLQTLGQQREQLYMASSHLERARSSADQAKRLLRQMSSRALRNKLFLYGVIAALIIANGTVLYRIATKNK